MTQEVIDCVLSLGQKENVPQGIIIHNAPGEVKVNDFELDNIKELYGYNLHQNLYLNIQNQSDNQETQNEEDDVTNSKLTTSSNSESTQSTSDNSAVKII